MKRREKLFTIKCPSCGHEFEKSLPTAIFAPDVKDIGSGEFARCKCPSCDYDFTLNYRFAYTDDEESFMVINDPAFIDRKARLAFSTSLGFIGGERKSKLHEISLRITYNYDQLYEKINILGAGLDDKVVELMKYFLLESEDFAYGPDQIVRFVFAEDKKFYLRTSLNVDLTVDFSDVLYDTIVNNYGKALKKDTSYLIDRNWAEKFLAKN